MILKLTVMRRAEQWKIRGASREIIARMWKDDSVHVAIRSQKNPCVSSLLCAMYI